MCVLKTTTITTTTINHGAQDKEASTGSSINKLNKDQSFPALKIRKTQNQIQKKTRIEDIKDLGNSKNLKKDKPCQICKNSD